jgi:hypothetical protein
MIIDGKAETVGDFYTLDLRIPKELRVQFKREQDLFLARKPGPWLKKWEEPRGMSLIEHLVGGSTTFFSPDPRRDQKYYYGLEGYLRKDEIAAAVKGHLATLAELKAMDVPELYQEYEEIFSPDDQLLMRANPLLILPKGNGPAELHWWVDAAIDVVTGHAYLTPSQDMIKYYGIRK